MSSPDLRRAYLVLAVVGLAGFQTAMALSIVFVAYPDIQDAFPGSSAVTLSWVLNIFSIVGAATNVLGGAVSERIGRKRAILLGVGGFTAASVLAALAPAPVWIIVARALMALAASLILPVSAAVILTEFPDSHRGVAMGLWSGAGSIAGAAGPSLGGWLVEQGGWQWSFWINVPLGALALGAGAVVLRESRDEERRPWPDAVGAVLLMFGVGAVVLGLVQTREWGWADARTLGVISLGALLLTLMARRSQRHPRPIVRPDLLRIPSYRAGNVMMLFLAISFFGFQFTSIQFLTGPWGYDIATAGLLSTPMFLFIAVTGPLSGRFVDRVGPQLLAPSALVWSLSLLLFAFGLGGERDLGRWLLFVLVAGVGSGLVWGAGFAVVMRSLPVTDFSSGASVTQTLQRVGNALGVAVMVTVVSEDALEGDTDGYPAAFVLLSVLGLVASVAARRTARVTPVSAEPGP